MEVRELHISTATKLFTEGKSISEVVLIIMKLSKHLNGDDLKKHVIETVNEAAKISFREAIDFKIIEGIINSKSVLRPVEEALMPLTKCWFWQYCTK